ncbi:glycosyltransferase family 4 protein [Polaribacter sp. IC063]|uniref:glycosyltransferase family 4 protein n=1 Tax=Polaribacter sp. IC063 TaxID=57031 RepID=UPI0011BDE4D0|nr:glycosyltransferase family 4 protein [Polaribacter sp. IC063]TXD51445.1 glycosyltransferase family 4 protein [Polaribacter sp. IC063]
MKILIVSQYFWPENFRINDLALGLQERGNEIHVLTGKPNYPKGNFAEGYSFFKNGNEEYKGIKIFRSNLVPRGSGSGLKLMLNYFSFVFFASIKAFFHREKYDFIFVYEPSPITVGIPAIVLAKKIKIPIYFWVQDLWPESVSAAGQFNNKIVLNILNSLTKWVYKNSKSVLIQSEGFREYIRKQGVENSKISYYPNSTEALYNVVKPTKEVMELMPKVPFTVLFAGNIGESQDFECIIEAAKILKEKSSEINFVILGNGRKKQFVSNKVKEYGLESNFHLLGSFPVTKMPCFFACADALLVTLKDEKIFSLTIPSKVQSYLACGKPIIGALNGEGAKVILDSKSGLVASAGDQEQLADKIFELYKLDIQQRGQLGKNARIYFEENFEREKLIDKLLNLVKT